MKTTLEIPDDLFRQAKAMAALRGESVRDFFTTAIQTHLERQATGASARQGWRSVFADGGVRGDAISLHRPRFSGSRAR